MKIKRNVLGDIYEVAQAIARTDEKASYSVTIEDANGQHEEVTSPVEYAKGLAEYIVDRIDEEADDKFFKRYIEEDSNEQTTGTN